MSASRALQHPAGKPGPLRAYVLHTYDWSESSLILDVFTRAKGRLVVLAKGAKRPYSQLRAVLLPLQPIHIVLTHKRSEDSEVHALRSAEWVRPGLVGHPQALLPGLYLNELLMKLLPRHDAHPRLFDVYASTLDALAQGQDTAAALRAFELFLLQEQGVLPELHKVTATRETVRAERDYVLDAQLGLYAAMSGKTGLPGSVWSALQEAMDNDDVPRVRQICALASSELKAQLRQVLSHQLGHHPLHTRQLLIDFQAA